MYERIVVGTDGSESAGRAVRHALRLAKASGATVHVVTAWQPMPALALSGQMGPATPMPLDDGTWVEELHLAVKDQGDVVGVPVESHRVEGPAAQVILELVKELEADLVVVGNAGMHGLRGHLASVPNTVAHKAPCAVLLVPTT
ncbi:MAG TPA: universal stress protein [Mycobacteriales bacterium]|nr:universal stress protein [Mycobacteriales bacterium]